MWRELTEDDVLNALNAAELAVYRKVQANVDGSDGDVLPEIIIKAVQEARGHIGDCASNRLAAGNTVPDRVVHHVVSVICYRLSTRLGIKVKEDRKEEYKDARRFLERVSECKVAIEWPEGETEESGNVSTVDVVSSSARVSTRDSLKGL